MPFALFFLFLFFSNTTSDSIAPFAHRGLFETLKIYFARIIGKMVPPLF